jgi:hypothetical protein
MKSSFSWGSSFGDDFQVGSDYVFGDDYRVNRITESIGIITESTRTVRAYVTKHQLGN